MKSWNELTFSDNFLFCKIMEDESLCRELIEILLHIKIKKLIYNKTERQIEPGFASKGIRMDVYLEDSNKIYDIEMQTSHYSELPLRVRYYQGAMDLSKVKKRSHVNELKETYILFICKEDPFKAGIPVYTIENIIKESPETHYNDKTHRVFYNCSAYNYEKDKDLKGLLEYISTNNVTTDFSKKLECFVTDAKTNNDWEDSYMFLSGWLEDELKTGMQQIRQQVLQEGLQEGKQLGLEEGLKEGLQQGIEEGILKGINSEKTRIAKEMLTNNFSMDQISKITGLEEAFIQELR